MGGVPYIIQGHGHMENFHYLVPNRKSTAFISLFNHRIAVCNSLRSPQIVFVLTYLQFMDSSISNQTWCFSFSQ